MRDSAGTAGHYFQNPYILCSIPLCFWTIGPVEQEIASFLTGPLHSYSKLLRSLILVCSVAPTKTRLNPTRVNRVLSWTSFLAPNAPINDP